MRIWRKWLFSYHLILFTFFLVLIGFIFYSHQTLVSQEHIYQETRTTNIRQQVMPTLMYSISAALEIQLARINEHIGWIRRRAKDLLESVSAPTFDAKAPLHQWIFTDPPVTLLTRVNASDSEARDFVRRFSPMIRDITIFKNRFPYISAAYIMGRSGMLYTPARDLLRHIPTNWNPSITRMFRSLSPDVNPDRRVMWSQPYDDRAGLGRIITAYAPVDLQDGFVVLGFDIQVARFSSILENARLPLNQFVVLVYSPGGQLITVFPHANLSLLGNLNPSLPQPSSVPPTPDWNAYPLTRIERQFHVSLNVPSGQPMVYKIPSNSRPSNPLWLGIYDLSIYPWKILLAVPDSSFHFPVSVVNPYTHQLQKLAVLIFLLLVVYIGIVIINRRQLEHHLLKPLQTLENHLLHQQTITIPQTDFEPIKRVAVTLQEYQKAREFDLAQLESYRHRMEELLRTVQESYVLLDQHGIVKTVNPSFENLFKVPAEEIIGRPFLKLFRSESQEQLKRQLEIWRQRADIFEQAVILYDKTPLFLRFNATPLASPDGDADIALFIVDLTMMQSFSEELDRWTHRDVATGMLNRRAILKTLEETLQIASRERKPFAICLFSIDHHEELRTRYHVNIADAVFKTFITSITLPTGAIAGRYSEHEILVVMPDADDKLALKIAEKCRTQLGYSTLFIPGQPDPLEHVSMSVAITIYPDHGQDSHSLLRSLHACMIRARELGGDRTIIYQPMYFAEKTKEARFDEPLLIVSALDEGRIFPYFQPIYQLTDRHPIGFEILVRLRDTDGSLVRAASFIHTLEHLPPADQLTFDRFLWSSLARYSEQIPPHLLFFQNISPVFLTHPNLFLEFCNEIIDLGLQPNQIVFEIPERTFIRDPLAFQYIAAQCHTLGFRFAIDDFGTGFTSFQLLQYIPLDFIKIDGEYIRNITHSSQRRSFVSAFVSIARNLNIQVIAEHVENQNDLETLTAMGVEYGQGFHLCRPLEMTQILERFIPTGKDQ